VIKVYGASDDLIEIDGDIREEFNTHDGILLFSDGTMLEVRFNGMGLWKISVLQAGEAHVHRAQVAGAGVIEDEESPSDVAHYTDVVHLIGGHIKFVALVDRLAWVG
jgi:hypothetical protein